MYLKPPCYFHMSDWLYCMCWGQNILVASTLATQETRYSLGLHFLLLGSKIFQLPELTPCWEMIQNANRYSFVHNRIQYAKVLAQCVCDRKVIMESNGHISLFMKYILWNIWNFRNVLCSLISDMWSDERHSNILGCCARSRYQVQGQVLTSHFTCGMKLLVSTLDTCFWHNTLYIGYVYIIDVSTNPARLINRA